MNIFAYPFYSYDVFSDEVEKFEETFYSLYGLAMGEMEDKNSFLFSGGFMLLFLPPFFFPRLRV